MVYPDFRRGPCAAQADALDIEAQAKRRLITRQQDAFSYAPRGMSRDEAARNVGVGTTKFDEMVSDGRMPKPKKIDGRVIWDRLRVEAAFTDLPDVENAPNPLDRMLGA
ncbi:putative DNA-binding transcriptional regulator AlpA [Bradyrhizobium japonicum]|nr:hypothetical protein BJS_06956 [Bradyrhizobium japonicum SEMIA 5079]MCS3979723.1 putative DNA-binding transcriptional regulator AlpA [Bradyrhizobium japonicum]